MSSVRKRVAPAKGKPAEAERPPRKPLFTPTNVAIVFGIIILVSLIVYWRMIHVAMSTEIARLKQEAQSQLQQAQVFRKKAEMYNKANMLSLIMEEKLKDEQKYFMTDLRELIDPFINQWLFDLLSKYNVWPEKVVFKGDIEFPLTHEMDPYDVVVRGEIQRLMEVFKWKYIGEGTGSGEVSFKKTNFLEPVTIKLEGFTTDYETLRKMVQDMQERSSYLITVHGFKNRSGEDTQYFITRTISKFDLLFTVYFMNPEGTASGDRPSGMPDDEHL